VILLDRDPAEDPRRRRPAARFVARGSRSRVLMLTAAAGAIEDRVDGLGFGAETNLPKPFRLRRCSSPASRALARRGQTDRTPLLARGDLRLDTVQRVATRAGRRLDLSSKELAVLELLLAAGGAPSTTRDLLARGWDEYVDHDGSVVKVTISRLRRKLGDPPLIETVPQRGLPHQPVSSTLSTRLSRRLRGRLPAPTIRLRLTLAYGGLFSSAPPPHCSPSPTCSSTHQ